MSAHRRGVGTPWTARAPSASTPSAGSSPCSPRAERELRLRRRRQPHDNLHRYYNPETARYTSPDPLGLAPVLNNETYVHNPHTWSGHLGLSPHRGDRRSGRPETPKPPELVTIRHFTNKES
ncbi:MULTISPECIES: RHS repeat-associated core domain-containing protein [Kitasatospora]|uniref:RHS repeat-associated core domain-containing protein n=1 Tax=Kitasatospora TaxID=2063 RepID=UPI001F2D7F3C|nr:MULTISPECIES: RHS repeat-associated core domain-containing protein [Kitasatospora]